jgi:hypothetical protein
MLVFKERPATLPPLGLESVDRTHAMSRGRSGHHRLSSAVPPWRKASVGLGFTPSALGNLVPTISSAWAISPRRVLAVN